MPRPPLEVFLTVDVEHGGSSAVRARPDRRIPPLTFDCEAAGGALGLPFIVETFRKNGLRGTFFVEPLASHYYGTAPLSAAVASLAGAGMDIQLHAHPAWLRFAEGRERPDTLHSFPPEEQEAILREALRLLREAGAPAVNAFRAGGFGADDRTYGVLRALGIPLSSSYNLAYLGGACRIAPRGRRNLPFRAGGVVEVPLTNYLIRDPRRAFRAGAKHFQVGNTRFRHGRAVLEGAWRSGLRCVNILLHNFEFVRRDRPDWFLGPFRPNTAVVDGFRRLCAYLARHPERYAVRAFGDLDAAWRDGVAEAGADAEHALPRSGGIYWPM